MKKIAIIFLLTAISTAAFAHTDSLISYKFQNKNSLQLDLGGHGLGYSVNYEKIILNGERFKTTAQVGIAYYPPITGLIQIWAPVIINQIYTFNKHHVEFGLGMMFTDDYGYYQKANSLEMHKRMYNFYAGRVGYRYQKPDGKFLFRASFTPLIERNYSNSLYPLGGVSFGWSF